LAKTYDFASFKKKVKPIMRAPISSQSYKDRFGWRVYNAVREDFTLEEIWNIIRSGEIVALRELSRYFYRTNAEYRNNIDFLAHLPLYDTVIIPNFEEGKGSKT
jgi:deoxyribodipyrimidine photolyase